jgi:hypothetical protein
MRLGQTPVSFFICHPPPGKLSCDVLYSPELNPYTRGGIDWGNTWFELVDGGSHFFDWLIHRGAVSGAELHLFNSSLLAPRSRLDGRPSITWDRDFATIWFTEKRIGTPKIAEDWQSFFYRSQGGDWIVVLGTNFLTDDEVQSLRRLALHREII